MMQVKLLNDKGGERTFSVVLSGSDDVFGELQEFVVEKQVTAARFTAIGAFSEAVLGYFDWQKKKYVENKVAEQTEVASLSGDVASGEDGKPVLHIHCVLGRKDGSAKAGHLLHAVVRPTLEVIFTESPVYLRKRHDPESGLALIDPSISTPA